jgi:hypothetical protein
MGAGTLFRWGDHVSVRLRKVRIGIISKLTWHCCICCNPAKRTVASFIKMNCNLVNWPVPKSHKNYPPQNNFNAQNTWSIARNKQYYFLWESLKLQLKWRLKKIILWSISFFLFLLFCYLLRADWICDRHYLFCRQKSFRWSV